MTDKDLILGCYYRLKNTVSVDQNIIKLSLDDIRLNKDILNNIEPIKLTHELVQDLGFEKYNWNFYVLKFFGLHYYPMHEYFYISYDHRRIPIVYVHELQNIVRILANNIELTLKH